MKKTTVILALALAFVMPSLNASTLRILNTNPIVKKANTNPLCKAIATGKAALVKTLINQGVNVRLKYNGMEPIHYAAKYNRVELIKVLLNAGAKVHARCDNGFSALDHAKKTNAEEAAQFLKRFKKK